MAVRIRLKRFGKKKQPFYRVVVAEKSTPRDGKTLETLGTYDPRQEPVAFLIDSERVDYWKSVGAQASDSVERLLANAGIGTNPDRKSSNQGVSKKDRAPKAE